MTMVSLYLAVISNARNVLKTKGLNLHTFWLFTTVSTFLSCGFVPTNENMMAFSKNFGLLLILIPQVLLGNTLLPSCLRFLIWVLRKLSKEKTLVQLLVEEHRGDWVPTFATKPPLINFGCHSFWVDYGTMGTIYPWRGVQTA